jgi:hypothetical protein
MRRAVKRFEDLGEVPTILFDIDLAEGKFLFGKNSPVCMA